MYIYIYENFVFRLDSLEPDWRGADFKDPTSGWISVSCPQAEQSIPEEHKTLWDWVKEGNTAKLDKLVNSNNVHHKDDAGLALIHWASDRGHVDVVNFLLDLDKSVMNSQDEEGQTPLHYAASCGHPDVVRILLGAGADPSIKDSDGYLPFNSDTESSVKVIFEEFGVS